MNTLIHERLGRLRVGDSSNRPTPPDHPITGEHPHPGRLFLCLLWKEYRQLRSLWILLAVIIAGIVGLMYAIVIAPSPVISWNLILLLPVLFSLAAGAMSFGNEKEQGTDRWLIQWSVPPLRLYFAKYLVSLLGTIALAGIAWILVYFCNIPRDIPFDSPAAYFAVVATALLSSYILSAFISILTGRILLSAGLGTVAVVYIIYVTDWLFYYSAHPSLVAESASWVNLGILLGIVGFVYLLTPILFCIRLAGKWPAFDSRLHRADHVVVTHGFRRMLPPRSWTKAFLWKEWRQSWHWMLGLVLFSFYLFLCIRYQWFRDGFLRMPVNLLLEFFIPSLRYSNAQMPINAYFVLVLMVLAYLMGLTSYSLEQRDRSFRFLTNQGSRSMSIWFLKQSVWLPFLLIWISLILWDRWDDPSLRSLQWDSIAVMTAFAMAQLVSILIPQRIMALFIAVTAGSIVLVYSRVMQRLGVPILLLDLPLLLAVFLSSFLIMRGWMEEWTGRRSVLWNAGVLVGPILAVFTMCSLYRAYEIPVLPESQSLPRGSPPLTLGEIKTAKSYASILSKVRSAYLEHDPRFNAMNEQEYAREVQNLRRRETWRLNRELVKPLLETTKRPEGTITAFAGGVDISNEAWAQICAHFSIVSDLLIGSAEAHEDAGEWKEAKEEYLAIFGLTRHVLPRAEDGLSNYCWMAQIEAWNGLLRWAKQPESTSAQIQSIIDHLKNLAVFPPDVLRLNYLANYKNNASRHVGGRYGLTDDFSIIYFSTPWEKERSRRLFEYARVKHLTDLDHQMTEPKRTMEDEFRPDEIQMWNTDLAWLKATTPTLIGSPPYYMAMRLEDLARYHLALLAILAWKKDHGELPPDGDVAFRKYLGFAPVNHLGQKFEFVPIDNGDLFLVRPGY